MVQWKQPSQTDSEVLVRETVFTVIKMLHVVADSPTLKPSLHSLSYEKARI